MATIAKFYLLQATSPNAGTMPSNSPAAVAAPGLGGTVTGDASGAATARDATDTVGTNIPDVDTLITANANTSFQLWGHRRFVSRPLAAVTFSSGVGSWTFSAAAAESNAAHNASFTVCIYGWRPSTGAQVGTAGILALPEPGTTETALNNAASTLLDATLLDGDVLVFDVFSQFTQSMATAYTDSFSYSGGVEGSTTNNAAFIAPPSPLTLFTGAAAPASPPRPTFVGQAVARAATR